MFGIHQIEIDKNHSCYFVERPFGNYLFFPDFIKEKNDDFYKQKGGVYKQFLESHTHLNDIHGHFFYKFGAQAVIHSQVELFHEKVAIERAGIDFDEVSIDFESHGSAKWVSFKQKEKLVYIMGNDFYLTSDKKIFQSKSDKTIEWLTLFDEMNVNYIFFCHFEKKGHLVIEKDGFFNKFKTFFNLEKLR